MKVKCVKCEFTNVRECQVIKCKEMPEKEVHLIFHLLNGDKSQVFYLCKEHFKKCERVWKKDEQEREIYDLNPQEGEKVQFT